MYVYMYILILVRACYSLPNLMHLQLVPLQFISCEVSWLSHLHYFNGNNVPVFLFSQQARYLLSTVHVHIRSRKINLPHMPAGQIFTQPYTSTSIGENFHSSSCSFSPAPLLPAHHVARYTCAPSPDYDVLPPCSNRIQLHMQTHFHPN